MCTADVVLALQELEELQAEMEGDVGRDVGRCGEIQGDVGRCGEM